jgi:hypothetical protein
MPPVTSTGVSPAILERAAGLIPTSPKIAEVGTLVISLAARMANLAVPRRFTVGWPAIDSLPRSVRANRREVVESPKRAATLSRVSNLVLIRLVAFRVFVVVVIFVFVVKLHLAEVI